MINPKINPSWKIALQSEFNKPYFQQLKDQLVVERNNYEVYPAGKNIFKAYNLTPLDRVSVVILGQDPYHNKGQAEGLSFSVPEGITPPPSLRNIFKEIENDTGFNTTKNTSLERWAKQGVFLLNACLTVRKNQPNSHKDLGWDMFTDSTIKAISDHNKNVVFLLWGAFAQKKMRLIDDSKHLILKAPHPSPFSAQKGFFGCKHFSKTNSYLKSHCLQEIKW